MRSALILYTTLLALVLVACAPRAAESSSEVVWPSTVEEAVDILLSHLPADDVEWMRRNPKQSVTSQLYRGYGTGVRNHFGLWGGNDALLKSCGNEDPEGCSIVILEAMWDRVQAQTDPALRASLQCQFATMEKIKIDTTGWYLLTIGEMLDAMQAQIDRQVVAAAAPGCPTQMRIVPVGELNRQCFVRADFEDEITLDVALNWLGFRNGLTPRHAPPNLEFKFREPCAWPERPIHFEPTPKKATG